MTDLFDNRPRRNLDGGRVISIRGAREHNLKNVDLEIPRDRLVVFTGLSGSGKSSLAFDTIYAEGQRRYVESLSAYARQFLEMMQKPGVDQIDGAFYEIASAPALDKKFTHDIDVVVDRVVVRPDIAQRLAESFEQALKLADGVAVVEFADGGAVHAAISSPPPGGGRSAAKRPGGGDGSAANEARQNPTPDRLRRSDPP